MNFIFTRDQCREVDRRAIEEYGLSGLVLMENAGRGCADTLCEWGIEGRVLIVCGKGNNAGDGFVLARHLEIRGHDVRVLLLAQEDELAGDALVNWRILRHTRVPLFSLDSTQEVDVTAWLAAHGDGGDWLVDALLGTGARGAPRPPLDVAIDWFNQQAMRKMSVDVPSGLDCDTGEAAGPVIEADLTCTFVAMKAGFASPHARRCTGTVRVLDIGAPRSLLESIAG